MEILEKLAPLIAFISSIFALTKVLNDTSKVKRENLLKDIELYEKVGSTLHKERILHSIERTVNSMHPVSPVKHELFAYLGMAVYLVCCMTGIYYFFNNFLVSVIFWGVAAVALEALKRSTYDNFFGPPEKFKLAKKSITSQSTSRLRRRTRKDTRADY